MKILKKGVLGEKRENACEIARKVALLGILSQTKHKEVKTKPKPPKQKQVLGE